MSNGGSGNAIGLAELGRLNVETAKMMLEIAHIIAAIRALDAWELERTTRRLESKLRESWLMRLMGPMV